MVWKVLIVEDDPEINQLLSRHLSLNGYETVSAFTGLEAWDLLSKQTFDLVLLDLMLPHKSGDELLRDMRLGLQTPVIIISAKDLIHTKVDLLRLGADDYITKPFSLDEVLARVESCLRRSGRDSPPAVLEWGDIRLYPEEKRAYVDQEELALTAKEYEILELLLRHPRKVFSKANLFESIWEEEYLQSENTLNVHISNLRQKIRKACPDGDYIETVWGLGYRLMKN